MTATHIRILKEIATAGVISEWLPKPKDWPVILELMEGNLISARTESTYNQTDWGYLYDVRIRIEAREKLNEWEEEIFKKSFWGRIWFIVCRFSLWIGLLVGAAAYKAIDIIVERAMSTPPSP